MRYCPPAPLSLNAPTHHVGIQMDIDVFFRPGQHGPTPFGLAHFARGIGCPVAPRALCLQGVPWQTIRLWLRARRQVEPAAGEGAAGLRSRYRPEGDERHCMPKWSMVSVAWRASVQKIVRQIPSFHKLQAIPLIPTSS